MWEVSGQRGVLHYTSFELFPMTAEDRARALDRWPELRPYAEKLDARGEVRSDVMQIRVIEGDARRALPDWEGSADAWFLDGFAPARNPELWEQSLMKAVALHTRPGGSFATYSAACAVRRGLSEACFSIERVPGFGRKRHMLKGTLAP
jgi:tRNA U34 5-methylaminomethyl-2-thiouridine-forming methyltransferase MnmC